MRYERENKERNEKEIEREKEKIRKRRERKNGGDDYILPLILSAKTNNKQLCKSRTVKRIVLKKENEKK